MAVRITEVANARRVTLTTGRSVSVMDIECDPEGPQCSTGVIFRDEDGEITVDFALTAEAHAALAALLTDQTAGEAYDAYLDHRKIVSWRVIAEYDDGSEEETVFVEDETGAS